MFINPLWSKPGIKKELIILPVLLLIFLCSVYYFLFLEKSLPGNMLEKAIVFMEKSDHSLAVVICEEGEDYKLNFEGNLSGNGVLHGKITDFDLELYRKEDGELLVKDLKDGVWKEPSELNLQSLTEFSFLPFDFLGACESLFKNAVFLEDKPGETDTFISLQISPEFLHEKALDKTDVFGNDLFVNCVVSINKATSFINSVNLSFTDMDSQKEVIKRNFSFHPLDKSADERDFKTVYSSTTNS